MLLRGQDHGGGQWNLGIGGNRKCGTEEVSK